MSAPLKISENNAPAAPLLSSAVMSGKKIESAAPPDVVLKKGVLGISNTSAIYFGIALAALIVIPLGAITMKARIKTIWMHFQPPPPEPPAVVVKPLPPPVPQKIVLPIVKPGTFVLRSISLSPAGSLAVINDKNLGIGDPVEIAGQPGWKVAEIHAHEVVLDYYGNRLPVPVSDGVARKPLDDRLHALN